MGMARGNALHKYYKKRIELEKLYYVREYSRNCKYCRLIRITPLKIGENQKIV